MSKKQIAALVATALTAIAGVLTQCPEDPPARAGVTEPAPVSADAGAR